eukprot:10261547-Alexandrium_andersonii.AAC.1
MSPATGWRSRGQSQRVARDGANLQVSPAFRHPRRPRPQPRPISVILFRLARGFPSPPPSSPRPSL